MTPRRKGFEDGSGHVLRDAESPKMEIEGIIESKELVLDKKSPIIRVRLILENSPKQTLKLNTDHTIQNLYEHVKFLTQIEKFQLLNLGERPPKLLKELEKTVADMNLNMSQIKVELNC